MTDERKGRPSASNAERWVHCPGSFDMEKTVPDEGNDATDEGEMLHERMAKMLHREIPEIAERLGNPASEEPSLTTDQQELYDRAAWQFASLANEHIGDGGFHHIEERFWMGELFSGQLDYAWVSPDEERAVIVDWKFGRTAVESAGQNYQLLAYAVLLREQFPRLQQALVTVIQPRAGTPAVAEINRGQMAWAKTMLEQQAQLAGDGVDDRRPGKWCKYCRAQGICPEGQGYALALAQHEGIATAAQIGEVLKRCDLAEQMIQQMRDRARDMLLEDPDSIEGWTVKDAKPSLTTLKSAERLRTGLKGKALDEHMGQLLDGVIETKEVTSSRRNLVGVDELRQRLEKAGYTEAQYRRLGGKLTKDK